MIFIGSDHAGLELKKKVCTHLGDQVEDCGTYSPVSCDYSDIAQTVCEKVLASPGSFGILICGTGQGMAMSANKASGIRAGIVSDVFSAKMVRAHNNANVLCLGARVIGSGLALELIDAFLSTEFEGGRHAERVRKMEA